MVLSQDTQAPSHPDVQDKTSEPEENASLFREIQAEQVPEPTTAMDSSDLAPWTNPYADVSAFTPENAAASDQTDFSSWSTGPDLNGLWPYSQLPNTKVSHWIETENPGYSTEDSPAIDLRHHSHLGTDVSSEPQRHTLLTQRDASSAHPYINDPTHPSAPDTVIKDAVDTQAPGSPMGSSSSFECLYSGYSGIGSSSQSQQQTPQIAWNPLSPFSPIPGLASPVRGIVQPQRQRNASSQYYTKLTCPTARDGDVSHNLIEAQRQGSSTTPDIRYYPAIGSSLQPQQQALQNVSRDVGYGQAQVSGWLPTNFQDNNYLGVGPSSQPQQRSNASRAQRNKGKQAHWHPIPVAPSKRMAPPASDNVRAARPYPKPASQSLARTGGTRNVASASTGPRHPDCEEVDLNVFIRSTPGEEAGCASATTSLPHEPSSDSPTHPSQVSGRVSVPLRTWRPLRAIKIPRGAELRTVEFWTENGATGKTTPGTYFADRFEDGPDPDRSLVDPDRLPFPGKAEKGFNLRILWPGYEEYDKKISIHRPLATSTLREVRDWVYNAIAEFIQIERAIQTPEPDTWRVGADDPSAIHVEDLVLIRLRQVSKGSWVPEVEFVRTG